MERAELAGLKAQFKGKWEEAETLRDELARTKTQMAQREALFARRELEMRGIRSRCLSMVHALRSATQTLSTEQRSAHALLEGHFEMLQKSVEMSWLHKEEGEVVKPTGED